MSKNKRVLVIRAGQLGDTVCASSIINPLIKQFGKDTEIDWVAKAGIGNIFASDHRINRIFHLKSRSAPFFINPEKFRIIINSFLSPYDYIINLELASKFNDIVRLSRAAKKIGMPYRHFTEPAETHAVENLHLIYESFLSKEAMSEAQPSLVGEDIEKVRKKFNLPDNYIVLVPSNSHYDKKSGINLRSWPEENWCELFSLLKQNGLNAVMIGSDAEKTFFDKLRPLPGNIISLVGETSFPELASVINSADAVVSTDTGPAHMSAAVNTPVIALIGPTNYKRTGPYQTKSNVVKVISSNQPCSPCYHTAQMHQCTNNVCMKEISEQSVMDEILNLRK